MDKRIRRAGINAWSTLLNQLVATAIGIVIPGIMISHFGSEAYGATTSIAQFLGYIALFEGGIGRVARGALYKPLAMGDEEEVSRIYLAIKRFFTVLGLVFLGYTLILAVFYYDISDVTGFTREYTFALVLAIAVGKFAEYMGGITNITLFNADQRQYVVNSVIILSNILNVIAVALLATFGADILWVKLVSSLVFVLKPIIFTIYFKTHYRIKKSKTRAVLKNKATGIAQHMAYVVQNNTDVLVLTVFADLKLVAVYSVYHLISFSLRNITTSFTGGMEAVFGDMIAKEETEMLRKTYTRYMLILTLLTITLFGAAIALVVPFVRIYTYGTTDANYIQPVFALLLLLADALNCLILPCFHLPIAANKLKESQFGAYTEAAVNLAVSLLLVLWNPLIGVAMGTLVSAIFKSIYYITYSAKNVLKCGTGKRIGEFVLTTVVLLLVSVGGMKILSGITIANYFHWILAGFCTVAVTGTVSLLYGAIMYPEMMKGFIASVLKKIRK